MEQTTTLYVPTSTLQESDQGVVKPTTTKEQAETSGRVIDIPYQMEIDKFKHTLGVLIDKSRVVEIFEFEEEKNGLSIRVKEDSEPYLVIGFKADIITVTNKVTSAVESYLWKDIAKAATIINKLLRNYVINLDSFKANIGETFERSQPDFAKDLEKAGVVSEEEKQELPVNEVGSDFDVDKATTTQEPNVSFGINPTLRLEFWPYGRIMHITVVDQVYDSKSYWIAEAHDSTEVRISMDISVGEIAALAVRVVYAMFIAAEAELTTGHLKHHVGYFTDAVYNHLQTYNRYVRELEQSQSEKAQA